jgi:Rap/ran-GAP
VIVYQESGSFQSPLIPSTVIHNYFVVRPITVAQADGESSPGYRVGVVAHKGFSRYRPVIPESATFLHGEAFRQFLFYKLINGERAAHFCEKKVSSAQHSLLQHRLATRQGQIDFIVNNSIEPKESGSRVKM